MEKNKLQHNKGMKSWQADMLLVLVTFCWGVSYTLMDFTLEDMDPFTLNAHRFLIGGIVALSLGFRRVKEHINRSTIMYGLIIGAALVFTYIGATFGVERTTISNSGFLCAMTVVFIPIMNFILRIKQETKTLIAVIISFIGIALLTLNDDFSINKANLVGDLLCLSCGFFYAIDLIITGKVVKHTEVEAFTLGVVELLTVGTINLILSAVFSTPHFPTTLEYWGSTLFLSVFCTGLAFVIQPVAQQYTAASRVGVIFTLEPVFNAIVAFVIVHEIMTIKAYIGGAIMIFALIFMEVDFKTLFSTKKKEQV